LRFGLAGAASVDSGPAARRPARDRAIPRAKAVAMSRAVRRPVRHCPRFPRRLIAAEQETAGSAAWSRAQRLPRAARPQSATPPECPRRAPRNGPQFLDDHPETEHDHPVQAATAPATIMVLPRLNSLIEISEGNRQQARQQKAEPGNQ